MAKRTPPPKESVNLTADKKRRAISLLQRRIENLHNFDLGSVSSASDPRLEVQYQAVDTTLVEIFGTDTIDYERYRRALFSRTAFMSLMGRGPSLAEIRQALEAKKQRTITTLEGIIGRFREELEDSQESETALKDTTAERTQTRRVFVVHGRDDGTREAVARFLERIGFEPIILHEQANRGRTVIEKVEAHGDVSFAVVLLTPDDEGCLKGETPQPRPRQNVLLELGYFIGRLGRSNVCALKAGEIELPSDFGGVVWETFDGADGGWKQKLAKELQAAGYEIDWNKMMRP
jgi:predicted nucleotide-binding protein